MSFEYKVITASIPRPSETEKKPAKSGETTVGLQILVHLNIAGSYASVSTGEADFEDPLDAKMKKELATKV